jgi:hypothetical protein
MNRNHVRLGRKAVKTDSRTLRLSPYIKTLAPPPASSDWTKGITSWGMMLNDSLGDCTIAGVGHAVQVFTANTGSEVTVPDSTVLSYYESWDGYVNGDPSTDNGGIELDVLNNWQKNSFSGHKLLAFADPTVSNATEVKQSIALFGGTYIGMNVPNYIMDDIPSVWDVPTQSQDASIDGGHCVFITGYDASDLTFISWGSLYKMTWGFWNQFVDEAHALLSQDFMESNGTSASGFDLASLQADLAQIK